jgi:hypothetical protein
VTGTPTETPTGLPNGAACGSGSQCQSSFCADGVCCNRRCDAPIESCNLPGSAGTCVARAPVPATSRTGLLIGLVSLISVALLALRRTLR